jgi:hypothetical protein
VRELVAQQLTAAPRAGRVAAGAEDDVVADRVGAGAGGARRRRGAGVVVDAYVAQVAAEPRLHVGACGRLERAAGGAQHRVVLGGDAGGGQAPIVHRSGGAVNSLDGAASLA